MKTRKPKQVFLLYETSEAEQYLESVHATLEGAKREGRQRPVHQWGHAKADGTIEAKPVGHPYVFGLRIVPVELKE